MLFEEFGPIGKGAANAALESDDPEDISTTLLRLALNHDDWRWVQGKCLDFSGHRDVWVRRNCATALGHLARLHRQLDTTLVLPVLEALRKDSDVESWADSAIDDLTIFLRSEGMPE